MIVKNKSPMMGIFDGLNSYFFNLQKETIKK